MVSLSQLLNACRTCSGVAAVPVKVYEQADQWGANSQRPASGTPGPRMRDRVRRCSVGRQACTSDERQRHSAQGSLEKRNEGASELQVPDDCLPGLEYSPSPRQLPLPVPLKGLS